MTIRMSVYCSLEIASALVEVIDMSVLNNIVSLIKKASDIVSNKLTDRQKAICHRRVLNLNYPNGNGFIMLAMALELLSYATVTIKEGGNEKDKKALKLINLSRGKIVNYLVDLDEEIYNEGVHYANELLRRLV